MRVPNTLNWKVGGPAGEGIMTTGLIFSKTIARHGIKVFDYTEYPSLITGGHNTYQVYASQNSATSQYQKLDVLIALDKPTLDLHHDEFYDNTLVIYDAQDDKINIEEHNLPVKNFNLPMVQLATESGGSRLMANNVALGASMFLFGLDLEILNGVIQDVFGRKGEEIVTKNQNAAKAGYDFMKMHLGQPILTIDKVEDKNYLTMTGNEAISMGAIAGGLQLYTAYPMTPSSSVLHVLAEKAKTADIVVKHAEDEIGVINMALGASFAGVRSMVGTSGGGFCYMSEALGLSGVAEIPLVVLESMRPGPAAGMPTWTAQGDIQFIITASQDEFPRFVVAPADAQEAFELTRLAMDLSEKYQTLVIVVADKLLSESRHTMELESTQFNNTRVGFEENPQLDEVGFYPRYQDSESGIGKRTIPGQKDGYYLSNSYEHDKYGFASEEGRVRVEQVDKRAKKFELMKGEILPQYFEDNGGEMTLVSYGSTKGAVIAARELLEQQGIKVNIFNLTWIWPFPVEQVEKVLSMDVPFAVVEGNSTGQLGKIITMETGIKITNKLLKYDGRPFYPYEIVQFVRNTLKK
ncbi:MAG: 2-oxoacid:acceptor oxidoreductase subunit alpha [Candidatus Pacebacteria bacterium]|nr:2-oxoacid:acceptor oxidoreductase subunit alpha [Candidatus Paceibacterota bacterium]